MSLTLKWKDGTSYNRHERRETRIPRTYVMALKGIRDELIVTRHINHPDSWLIRLSHGGLEAAISDRPAEQAQAEAERILVEWLNAKASQYSKLASKVAKLKEQHQ